MQPVPDGAVRERGVHGDGEHGVHGVDGVHGLAVRAPRAQRHARPPLRALQRLPRGLLHLHRVLRHGRRGVHGVRDVRRGELRQRRLLRDHQQSLHAVHGHRGPGVRGGRDHAGRRGMPDAGEHGQRAVRGVRHVPRRQLRLLQLHHHLRHGVLELHGVRRRRVRDARVHRLPGPPVRHVHGFVFGQPVQQRRLPGHDRHDLRGVQHDDLFGQLPGGVDVLSGLLDQRGRAVRGLHRLPQRAGRLGCVQRDQ
mmetsp:Transcript_34064/g.81169  ORF Transcript_34064/g.81169 Transcript_34064/m.81169 type:complete len:252 (+) Transcript_34064:1506-2261(+)